MRAPGSTPEMPGAQKSLRLRGRNLIQAQCVILRSCCEKNTPVKLLRPAVQTYKYVRKRPADENSAGLFIRF